jgi:hypothetical protein
MHMRVAYVTSTEKISEIDAGIYLEGFCLPQQNIVTLSNYTLVVEGKKTPS